MITDLTFKEVSKFLKKEDSGAVDVVDKLFGAVIVLSPIILGPQFLPVWGVLGVKNEVAKIGRSLIAKVNSKQEFDFILRMERMQVAYGLICFTAFFEALDRLLPDELRKKIDLQAKEKKNLSERASRKLKNQNGETDSLGMSQESFLDIPVPFPHPVDEFSDLTLKLQGLYDHMTKGFYEFIKKLAIWEEKDDKSSAELRKIIDELPKLALTCFEAQYFELARIYPDFCVWSRIHEQKTTQGKLKDLSDYLKRYASLQKESDKKIDVGFEKLHKIIQIMPEHFKKVESQQVVDGLKRHYEARINGNCLAKNV